MPHRPLMFAAIDGAVMDAADAQISVLDDGLLRGDGVFEVLRIYAGRPFGLDEHLERMARSAETLRLAFDEAAVRADVAALIEAGGAIDAGLRLVLTRGGRRIALLEPPKVFPASTALATITYSPTRLLDGVKSLSYGANMLATRLAKEAGADEALLVTPHGRVLEAPVAAFFYVLGGELCTPPLSDRILDSISRRVLLATADARERVTTLDDLATISEAFLASSLREVQPVRSIDGQSLPCVSGPVSAAAAEHVREHIEAALQPLA
ncbi:MAG TPA: aminotransferase class IV [Solirubrobacteraceae bacterium]